MRSARLLVVALSALVPIVPAASAAPAPQTGLVMCAPDDSPNPFLKGVACGAELTRSGAGVGMASPSVAAAPSTCLAGEPPAAVCQDWTAEYDGPAHGSDGVGEGILNARVLGTSADGSTVYAAAGSDGDPGSGIDADIAVIADDAVTGTQRWATRDPGPANYPAIVPFALAVSPTGSGVFVVGTGYDGSGEACSMRTDGFDAATGVLRWTQDVQELDCTSGFDAVASPDGTRVYVTGTASGIAADGSAVEEGLTIAYDTTTGDVVWFQRYTGGGARSSSWRMAVSPDGSRVYVGAAGLGEGGETRDVILLTYDATKDAQGRELGTLLHESHHPTNYGFPVAGMVVARDGSRVFLEEANLETGLNNDLTFAYDRAGNELWTARLRGCDALKCSSRPWYYDPIAVSPDGTRVYVTSLGVIVAGHTGFITVAYDATTGSQQWVTTVEGQLLDCICGPEAEVNPRTGDVYVSGAFHYAAATQDCTTLAFDPATGLPRWTASYVDGEYTGCTALAVAPDGKRLFIAGGASPTIASGSNAVIASYRLA